MISEKIYINFFDLCEPDKLSNIYKFSLTYFNKLFREAYENKLLLFYLNKYQ